MSTVRSWRCYRCGHPFAHARYLVTRLLNLHSGSGDGLEAAA